MIFNIIIKYRWGILCSFFDEKLNENYIQFVNTHRYQNQNERESKLFGKFDSHFLMHEIFIIDKFNNAETASVLQVCEQYHLNYTLSRCLL